MSRSFFFPGKELIKSSPVQSIINPDEEEEAVVVVVVIVVVVFEATVQATILSDLYTPPMLTMYIIISKALPLWRNVDAIRSTKSYYLDDDEQEEEKEDHVNIQVDDIYDYALCVYYDMMMIMTMLCLM